MTKPPTPSPDNNTRSKFQPGRMFQYRSKAEWVRKQFPPDPPTFPLHAEVIAQIPKDLPGEIPESLMDLYGDPTPAPRRTSRRKVDDYPNNAVEIRAWNPTTRRAMIAVFHQALRENHLTSRPCCGV